MVALERKEVVDVICLGGAKPVHRMLASLQTAFDLPMNLRLAAKWSSWRKAGPEPQPV